MLKVWNMLLVILAFCLALFGTFLTRSGVDQLDPLVHPEPARPVVPRLHLPRHRRLARAARLAPAAAALEDADGVARLARGDVPLQQPAARRALPDDPLGRDVPDPVRGRAGRADHGQRAVLQLLPADLRASAAPADGDRAARRLAAGVAALARPELRLACRDRGRGRDRPPAPRRGLVSDRARRLHVLGLRARLDRLRVRARDACPAGAHRRLVAVRLRGARRPQPAALRRVHRARVDRPARDRHRRLERLRHGARAEAEPRPDDGRRRLPAHVSRRSSTREGPNATEFRAHLDVRRGGRLARHDRVREERLPRRGSGLERGRDPQRPPDAARISS